MNSFQPHFPPDISYRNEFLKLTSDKPLLGLGIPFFGREEHFALLSRIWFSRDARSLASSHNEKEIVRQIKVTFFCPEISKAWIYPVVGFRTETTLDEIFSNSMFWTRRTVCDQSHLNEISNELLQTDNGDKGNENNYNNNVPHHVKQSQNDIITKEKALCPFKQPIFCHKGLKVNIPCSQISNFKLERQNQEKYNELKNRQVVAATLNYPDTVGQCVLELEPKGPQIDPNDKLIELIPLFSIPVPTFKLANDLRTINLEDSLHTTLSLIPIFPLISSDTRPDDCNNLLAQNVAAGITVDFGLATFEPSPAFSTHLFQKLFKSIVSCPFILISIDLCDPSSINYAIWAYHILIYLHNNASIFPNMNNSSCPDKILVTIFNRTALDHLLVTETQIYEWFDSLPYETEFFHYGSMFHLSDLTKETTIQPKIPTTNPHLLATNQTKDPKLAFLTTFFQDEESNIDYVTFLDHLYISQCQRGHLFNPQACTTFETRSKTKSIFMLPSPLQSILRYPFPSMIGKPIDLGVFSFHGLRTEIIVPNQMPHFCLFDQCFHQYNHLFDRRTGRSVDVLTSSSPQPNQHITPGFKTNPLLTHNNATSSSTSAVNHANNTNSKNVEELLATPELSPFSTRGDRHPCNTLHFQYISPSLYRYSSGTDDPWNPRLVQDLLGADSFDFLITPHQTLENPSLHSSDTSSRIFDSFRFFDKNHQTPAQFPINLVKQTPNFLISTLRSQFETLCLSEINSISIDHYSSCSVQQIYQDDRIMIDSSTSTEIATPTTPTTSSADAPTLSSVKTAIFQSATNLGRFYSMMHIDDDMKDKILREQNNLLLYHTSNQQTDEIIQNTTPLTPHLSPLSRFNTKTSNTLNQFLSSSTLENPKGTKQCQDNQQESNQYTTPLSNSPHHLHIISDPYISPPFFLWSQNLTLPYNSLFNYSIINLSTLMKEIAILQSVREFYFKHNFSIFRKIVSLKGRNPRIDHRFTAQSFPSAHALHLAPTIAPSHPPFKDSSTRQFNPPSSTNPINTTTKSLASSQHTISTYTVDIPNQSKLDQLIENIPSAFQISTSRLVFDIQSLSKVFTKNSVNRNICPHFFIILDDTSNSLTTSNPPQSFYAGLMNSYLSHYSPPAHGNLGITFPIHYCCVPADKLKTILFQCIQLAIAMRMDNYSSFE